MISKGGGEGALKCQMISKIYVELPSKSNDLGVFENLDFFTVDILNNVFCKFQVIPAENDFGISNFPLCSQNTTFEIIPFKVSSHIPDVKHTINVQ